MTVTPKSRAYTLANGKTLVVGYDEGRGRDARRMARKLAWQLGRRLKKGKHSKPLPPRP